jgi:phage gp29-like protein
MSELLATGLGFGSSLAEIFWQIKNREVGIEKIEVRENRWLRYDDAENPAGLTDFPRWVTTKNPGGIELDTNRFIHFAPLAGRRHPVRSGLYRGLVWLWLFTNYTVKDYLAFNELFGQPMRVGKYGRNASDEERAALRSAVRNLGSDSAAVIDEDSVIEFIQAQAKGSGQYEPALRYFNAEKSKRVLGATLTVEQGGSGSYAQAKVHGDVRMEIIRSDARKLEESINDQLIKRMVDYNFGAQTSYPQLTIKTDSQTDSVLILENCERLKKLGLSFDESWLRKEIGIPPADSDDETGKRED